MGGTASHRSFLSWIFCASVLLSCGRSETEAKAAGGQGFLPPPPELVAATGAEPLPEDGLLDSSEHSDELSEVAPGEPAEPSPSTVNEIVAAGDPPTSIDEAELGGALLHLSGAAFESLLARRGQGLSDNRRALMMAFSAALAGNTQRARELADPLSKAQDVTAIEWALLVRAMGGGENQAIAAGAPNGTAGEVFGRAAGLALRAREAEEALQAGNYRESAQAFSDVLLADLAPPWPVDREALARWSQGLERAQSGHRWNVRGEWPSVTIGVQAGDSLVSVRRRALSEHSELLICTGLVERANQLRNELAIHPGDELRIPTDPIHALVDVSARWMVYLHGDEAVAAWPIGVGKPGEDTPLGQFTLGPKQKDPVWFRPGHEPVAFGDPENPLGTRWLPWLQNGKKTGYGFHGTNDASGVGGQVSKGCVRMRNQDVEILYEILPQGARIVVRP